jgi:hypothetical protein
MENAAWRRAEKVAAKALDGQVMTEVGDATHFHVAGTGSNWSAGLLKVAQIGAHVFYRFGGRAGAPSMFHGQPLPSDGPPATHPIFASLALSAGSASAPSPANLIASASAAVEHAASAVESAAAKTVAAPDQPKPAPASAPKAQPAPGDDAPKVTAPQPA